MSNPVGFAMQSMLLSCLVFLQVAFRRTLVADGNFTADNMKMRCPEEMLT